MKRKTKGDVEYRLPNKKRPIAHSTKATSDLISILSEIFLTINDVRKAICYDEDAKKILDIYIEKGYGEEKANTFFRYNDFGYCFNWQGKIYAILLANFPFTNTIDEVKQYVEYRIIDNKRVWMIKDKFKKLFA